MFLLSNSTFNYMDGYEVHHRVWQGYSGPQSMDVPCNKNTTKLPQRELQPWQCDSDVPCTIYNANITISFNWRPVQLLPHRNSAGDVWKRSFIFPVRPTVHTNPWRKRSFTKTLENADFSFSCGEKTFWKRWRHGNHVISLSVFSKLSSDCCARSVEENILMRFQSERPPFSKSSAVVRA